MKEVDAEKGVCYQTLQLAALLLRMCLYQKAPDCVVMSVEIG